MMKRIVLFICLLGAFFNATAQTYGGETKAKDNSNVIGSIKRTSDQLKVSDSVAQLRLTTINTTLGTPFQAGGSIGNTGFNVTGTLPAFSAIPAFKVDQTTPGTTNKVSIGTDGTVAINAALPTGTNSIGQVTANAGTNLNTSALALESGGNLATLVTRTPALGQATAANSRPVTLNLETASGTITTQNLVPAGVATAGSAVEITLAGASMLAVQTTGTYTGALSIQVTADNSVWVTVGGVPFINLNTGGNLATITSALQSVFQVEVGGFIKARITGLAAMTGTATVTIRAISNTALVSLDAAIPTGANTIGAVTIGSGTVTTVSTVTAVTNLNGGQTANSSASTGNPLRAGGRVVPTTAATQDQTYVAGDAAEMPMTTGAQLIQKPYGTAETDWQSAAAASGIVNTTTAVTFKAASGTAGIRNYITGVQIQSEALGTATELAIRDGAAGTVIWRYKIGTTGTPLTSITFPTPLRGTANTLLEVVTLTASTTGAVYFNAQGYTGF